MPIDNDHLNPRVTVEEKIKVNVQKTWMNALSQQKIKGNIIKDTIAISQIVGNPQN